MRQDGKPMVRLERFEKRYGELLAVQDVDFEVSVGEAYVLLGANGSGKSTILRAVVGLHAPSRGRVLVDGIDVAVSPQEVKQRIAYLPQRVAVPGQLTGREVLLFYAQLKGIGREKIDEALAFAGLSEDADRFTKEYSGGMVQRLGLGITYLKEAPLLLLDEPTLNLDPEGVEQFRSWIHALQDRGATVLFTSHILQEALRLADRVGVLADGRLVSVQEAAGFRERVVLETQVRVVLSQLTRAMIDAARQAGAVEDTWSDTSYSFKASPDRRQKVIRAIEGAGGFIEELHTEAPKWEALVEASLGRSGAPGS